jgi:hypothetical protein
VQLRLTKKTVTTHIYSAGEIHLTFVEAMEAETKTPADTETKATPETVAPSAVVVLDNDECLGSWGAWPPIALSLDRLTRWHCVAQPTRRFSTRLCARPPAQTRP